MADEVDISVKVVDRRRWREDGEINPDVVPPPSLKPTYVEELERRVAQAEQQSQEFIAKYRQASQEFEDARARMRKELAKDAERNRRDVFASLLEVIDNFDRAIDAARKTAAADDPLLHGVELVRQQFLSTLEGFGVRRIDRDKGEFDPLLHEAVATVPASPDLADGQIAGVIRAGYLIRDEVLRPALVAVAKAGT